MSINIARFYRREKLELDCEIVTPMFLGNASQEAELRTAPFKGLLRYWWRVAEGMNHPTPEALLEAENRLFGSPDEELGGKSQVTVEVSGDLRCYPPGDFPKGKKILHAEVKNKSGNPVNIDRFLYLGYGPITSAGVLKSEGKGAFIPNQHFRLSFTGQEEVLRALRITLHCMQRFGAIGGRSRNGWGCFSMTGEMLPEITEASLFQQIGADWEFCLDRDYPHRLGLTAHKALLWLCRNPHDDWKEVMNELAEIYLTVRLEHKFPGEKGPHNKPLDRHALGYPAGRNHGVKNWGNAGRHGSALRLFVRKEADGHRGYILHLPHLFSREMWPDSKDQQIAIWKKVHTSLDKLCQRVVLKEARS